MKNTTKSKTRDCIVKGTNISTGEVDYFLNVSSAAKSIGGAVSHVYNVLRGIGYYKTVKGWKLEWVDLEKLIKNV